METKLGLGGMWSVLGQALRIHGHTSGSEAAGGGRQVRPWHHHLCCSGSRRERSSATRAGHSRWPAAGRGNQAALIQPARPSPRLSCAEDCSVDAAAGLPTNTTQRMLRNSWDFLGFLSMRPQERLGFLSVS